MPKKRKTTVRKIQYMDESKPNRTKKILLLKEKKRLKLNAIRKLLKNDHLSRTQEEKLQQWDTELSILEDLIEWEEFNN